MIIQCRTCRTKYRFDEAQISRDGVWVRCTRCQKVFFQHPPLLNLEMNKSDAQDQETLGAMKTANIRELSEPPELPDLSESSISRSASKRVWVWTLGTIMLIIIVGGGILLQFPQYCRLAMNELQCLFPGQMSFTAREESPPLSGAVRVKIMDVKQRFLNNVQLGNIRIIEGVVMNTSVYPISKLKVRGELFDEGGTLLRHSLSFCGNMPSDEALEVMSEEQIFQELNNPQGGDAANDKIAPNGTLPFMIIFNREPPGVTRTFVMPVIAEEPPSSKIYPSDISR